MTDQTRDIVERLRSDDDSYDLRDEAVCAIEALTKRVAELEGALLQGKAALQFSLAMNKRARNTIPDEEEGLAAEVFAYHINHADRPMIGALTTIDAALSNAARGEEI
jgi:hypothetical protein